MTARSLHRRARLIALIDELDLILDEPGALEGRLSRGLTNVRQSVAYVAELLDHPSGRAS